jgi:hypothetical protein
LLAVVSVSFFVLEGSMICLVSSNLSPKAELAVWPRLVSSMFVCCLSPYFFAVVLAVVVGCLPLFDLVLDLIPLEWVHGRREISLGPKETHTERKRWPSLSFCHPRLSAKLTITLFMSDDQKHVDEHPNPAQQVFYILFYVDMERLMFNGWMDGVRVRLKESAVRQNSSIYEQCNIQY